MRAHPTLFVAPFILLLSFEAAPAQADCGKPSCTQHSQYDSQAASEHSATSTTSASTVFDQEPQPGDMAVCPVTGETFQVTSATLTSEHDGKYYAFCCPGCKPKFDADPQKYSKSDSQGTESASRYFPSAPEPGVQAVCPVSGKTFTVSESTPVSEYGGHYYAFCCPGCKPKFEAQPESYTQ